MTSWHLGRQTEERCGRPLACDAISNAWVCPVVQHGVIYRGDEPSALAIATPRFEDEAA
jgi:hypothetical protein